MSFSDLLGRFRVKYPVVAPKAREVVVEETGEVIAAHDELGREVLDPTPVAPPVRFERGLSQQEHIRRLIQVEMSRAALEEGQESFEEADDFDTGEGDDLPLTRWEAEFDPDFQQVKDAAYEARRAEVAAEKGGTGVKPLSKAPKEPEPTAKPSQEPKEGDTP